MPSLFVDFGGRDVGAVGIRMDSLFFDFDSGFWAPAKLQELRFDLYTNCLTKGDAIYRIFFF